MHKSFASRSVGGQLLLALLLAVTQVATALAHDNADPQAIIVTAVKGEVRVTMRGEARAVRSGTVIELPATIQTGAQASLDLKQDHTTVSIAADTRVEIPASAAGTPIDRIIQSSGNAFYAVGKRESKKLLVETPFLVAVIKGTQFNVAVQGDGATVSLFEGRLEVRASDGADVVNLDAGEMATRQQDDKTIGVLKMSSGEAVRTPATSGDAAVRPAPANSNSDSGALPGRTGAPGVSPPGGSNAGGGVTTPAVDVGVGVSVEVDVDVGARGAPADASAGIGAGAIDAAVDAGGDLGASGVSARAEVSAGVAAVDVGASVAVDAAAGGVAIDAAPGVDAAPFAVDVGVGAAIDARAGAVDLGADASLGAGGAPAVDLGVGAGPAPDPGAVDPGVSADVGTPAADLGVDAGLGNVDLGVDLGIGTGGVDTGVDLDTTPEPTPAPEPPSDGGLLGGLLGGLGRRN